VEYAEYVDAQVCRIVQEEAKLYAITSDTLNTGFRHNAFRDAVLTRLLALQICGEKECTIPASPYNDCDRNRKADLFAGKCGLYEFKTGPKTDADVKQLLGYLANAPATLNILFSALIHLSKDGTATIHRVTSCTLHPQPQHLHPTPQTLDRDSCTLNPTP
jgi:hypothetical protein